MCGIVGFAGDGDLDDLERMAEKIRHRGPDEDGIWYDPNKKVYLAHKRLSIIDLPDGKQPMWTADKEICVIFNGEIYNHEQLRESLEKEGYIFRTDHSDTEVLLYGYRKWGNDLPLYLNGMWAFAIYERKRNILFISRDRFGKKPLYYCLKKGIFVFASELSVMLEHSLINESISLRSLKKYFAYGYIPAPSSLYSGIYKLPGGHNLIFDRNSFTTKVWKYWDFIIEPFETIPDRPEDVWGEQLRELLKQSVKRRLMSDVPLGVFLSGGIDSSSVAAVAAELAGKENIKTFCIGFSEDSFDESKYSNYAATLIGTDHTSRVLLFDTASSILPEIINRLDEPFGDSSLIPTYLLCHETKKHVTVALGGDGADELFAGYDPFHALKLAEIYKTLIPKPIHKGIRLIAARLPVSHRNFSLDFKIKRTLRGLSYPKILWNPVWLGPLEPVELKELFEEAVDIEDIYSEAIECWDSCSQKNIIDKTLQFYTKLYLQDNILTKIDRAGMMNSLEVRAPYLDINLADFVRRIPGNYKYRFGQTKYILKKAIDKLLPRKILYRKKHGFGIPIGKWFEDNSLTYSEDEIFSFLKTDFIIKRQEEHLLGQHDHRMFLWNYWVLRNFQRN